MGRGKNLYILVGIFCLMFWVGLAEGVITEQAKLVASDGNVGDYFGYSVSISGDYAIVGACYDDDNGINSGSAYIFKCDGMSWSEQAKLVASDGTAGDYFGYSVSVSGDYAIVGAEWGDGNGINSGSAYIFKRDGASWSEQAKLVASDGANNDQFGFSVSINGDDAIVGARGDDDYTGSAYVFKRDGTNWSEQAKLVASDGNTDDYFGESVSININGDYAIAGARYDDGNGSGSGSAYIFAPNEVDPNNWDQVAKLTASDGNTGDAFGFSVSISGDYVVVGAFLDDNGGISNSGSAYIFKRDGMSWSEQAKLVASDGTAGDYFGESVSININGDYAIAGARGDDNNGSWSGSAYIFKRDGMSWSEQAKLVASDGAPNDYLGYSVSISGDYAIVGAYGDDDNGSNSGSAYIFGKCPVSDLNGDCFIDFKDLAILAGEWLQGGEWGVDSE